MAAVFILGILAAIAVPNFKKFQAKSKTPEATLQLSALYTGQQIYIHTYNTYAACTKDLGIYPSPEGYYITGFDNIQNHGKIKAGTGCPDPVVILYNANVAQANADSYYNSVNNTLDASLSSSSAAATNYANNVANFQTVDNSTDPPTIITNTNAQQIAQQQAAALVPLTAAAETSANAWIAAATNAENLANQATQAAAVATTNPTPQTHAASDLASAAAIAAASASENAAALALTAADTAAAATASWMTAAAIAESTAAAALANPTAANQVAAATAATNLATAANSLSSSTVIKSSSAANQAGAVSSAYNSNIAAAAAVIDATPGGPFTVTGPGEFPYPYVYRNIDSYTVPKILKMVGPVTINAIAILDNYTFLARRGYNEDSLGFTAAAMGSISNSPELSILIIDENKSINVLSFGY